MIDTEYLLVASGRLIKVDVTMPNAVIRGSKESSAAQREDRSSCNEAASNGPPPRFDLLGQVG